MQQIDLIELAKALLLVIPLSLVCLLLINKIQHPSDRFLGRRQRRHIIERMRQHKALPLEDLVLTIAYLAQKDRFSEADVKDIVRELDYPPYNVGEVIRSLRVQEKLQPEIFRRLIPPHEWTYYMPKASREAFHSKFREFESDPEPEKRDLSAELQKQVAKVKDAQERAFLDETINCLHVSANRAAIVMGWNLAYHRLRQWILDKHLATFNSQLTTLYPKKYSPATCHDDFPEKESHTLEICKAANILDKNRKGFFDIALRERNQYAHPSPLQASGPHAVGYVSKLVENVINDPFFG